MHDLAAEPADLGRVVGRVHHRLGEQRQRADRGLQLVADVGHEVPAGGLQPDRFRLVRGVHHGERLGERADLGPDGGRGTAVRLAQRRQVDLHHPTALPDQFGRLPGSRIGLVGAHHTQRHRPGVVEHDVTPLIEHGNTIVG